MKQQSRLSVGSGFVFIFLVSLAHLPVFTFALDWSEIGSVEWKWKQCTLNWSFWLKGRRWWVFFFLRKKIVAKLVSRCLFFGLRRTTKVLVLGMSEAFFLAEVHVWSRVVVSSDWYFIWYWISDANHGIITGIFFREHTRGHISCERHKVSWTICQVSHVVTWRILL